jgi:hypothetical protein
MKFPALWICGLVLWMGTARVDAWGGLFNRFSPEMLSNLGYGSSHGGGSSSYRPQPMFQVRHHDDSKGLLFGFRALNWFKSQISFAVRVTAPAASQSR